MKHFLETFADAEVICIPSSSCVAMLRDHYPKMAAHAADLKLVKQVEDLLTRVFEFSELLVDKLKVTDVGAFYPHAVTLHSSCHSLRSLKIGDKPERLLRSVRGLTLTDLPDREQCCGFGGTFAIKNAEVSAAMLSDKVYDVLSTRAEVCTAIDNSCLMHIGGALSRERTGVKCVHLAEILAATGGSIISMSIRVGHAAEAQSFPEAAKELLQNTQLRHNVRHATGVIRRKRAAVVEEQSDWEQLRDSGHEIKEHTLRYLDFYLEQFERNCTAAGGTVHWARDADEANRIVVEIIRSHHENEVIKVKTMTSDETTLNEALEEAEIVPFETDLADLIVQLGRDKPSHIVVPALHRNKLEIRQIFLEKMNLAELGDQPGDLAAAARSYLREKFLRVKVGFCGANFLVADTGSVVVVESEGNGRMCVTLPKVLITLAGIEKVIPAFRDLEVFLQLLPRSATGERMNPYNSIWTGTSAEDGPNEFHVVLLDNGRTNILADEESRETLDCIRCGACLNACPVYQQTGGHAYGSVYGGPIGAILTPQLQSMEHSQSLPYASSLCGACYEVCPVKINIPEILVHLRGKAVEAGYGALTERIGMKAAAFALADGTRLGAAQKLARIGQIPFEHEGKLNRLPGMLAGWTAFRDLNAIPKQSFRDWWAERSDDQ